MKSDDLLQDLTGAGDQATKMTGAEVGFGGMGKALLEALLHFRLQAERLHGQDLRHGLVQTEEALAAAALKPASVRA